MKKFVAVTACASGIAHTYMAQEGLEKAAKELGYEIRVETRGAIGAENELTEDEIKNADAVVIAADKTVPMERFAGKKLLDTSPTAAIKDGKAVLEEALKAPVYTVASDGEDVYDRISKQKGELRQKQSGRGAYRHLMTGLSYVLPLISIGGLLLALVSVLQPIVGENAFLTALSNIGGSGLTLFVAILAAFIAQSIADRPGFAPGLFGGWIATHGDMFGNSQASAGYIGGILAGFLAGYLTKWLIEHIKMSKSMRGVKAQIVIPFLSITITGLIMIFVIGRPIAAFMTLLNNGLVSLGNSTNGIAVLGIVLGAMMASDMGGPFNKVAYFFALGLFADKAELAPLACACVVISGMIPPLGLGLATLIRRQIFTDEERQTGKAALIMGIFFITEGAIPFALADPKRVIPSIILGSAVGGAIVTMMNVQIAAPSIAALPLSSNVLGVLLALVVGSAIVAACTILLKERQLKKSAS